jgi:uncharacterized membrane protein
MMMTGRMMQSQILALEVITMLIMLVTQNKGRNLCMRWLSLFTNTGTSTVFPTETCRHPVGYQ